MGASSPEIELQCEPIKNRKMKTRCFDHIDLSVKNTPWQESFTLNFCRSLDLLRKDRAKISYVLFRRG
jgi:hypothetical protein